jgi:hypothetical protein
MAEMQLVSKREVMALELRKDNQGSLLLKLPPGQSARTRYRLHISNCAKRATAGGARRSPRPKHQLLD